MTLAEKLQLLSTWRGAQPDATTIGLWDLKSGVLSLLNDIDLALDYGKPGSGLDALLATKDRPINLKEAA